MAEDRVRIEIAFEGGQIIGIAVPAASAQSLEEALARGDDGTLTLDTAEGDSVIVVLGEVVYVKKYSREARIGF
jgi:hypothetical protein